MDFQTAPYDDLCGCVSALIPTGMGYLWKDDKPNHTATRNLIINAKGERSVLSNCPKCRGVGLKHSPTVTTLGVE